MIDRQFDQLGKVLVCVNELVNVSSKSRVRVDLRAPVRSLLSMRRLSRAYRTAGETVDTRQVDWCDQKHTVEGQTDTDRPSCVSRTVKSRARPKGVNLKR